MMVDWGRAKRKPRQEGRGLSRWEAYPLGYSRTPFPNVQLNPRRTWNPL